MDRMMWFCLLLISIASSASASPCSICEDIIEKFDSGLKKTAKANFGGGNTHWEEKSLGSFAFSETRLIEILEDACGGKECHTFLEKHEEDIEYWWFKLYAKKSDKSLKQFLCIEKAAVCCENGTYGPVCLPCKGGKEDPCRGRGNCDGAGTREGTGKCECNAGYTGDECQECGENYFEETVDKKPVCTACHEACKDGCEGPASKQCYDCKDGWELEDQGCLDINECEAKDEAGELKSPCKDNEYCTNNEGSYSCTVCDKACSGCTGAGADKCTACGAGHFKDEEDGKCKACHSSCDGSCIDATPLSCSACKEGWKLGDAGCEDINECESESAGDCEDDSYCTNNEGSFQCSTCHPFCAGCTGAGSNKCKACKEGYKEDDEGHCKDINECEAGDKCTGEKEECVNREGRYECQCTDGYLRKEDKCVAPKQKEPEKKPKHKAYKGPATCKTCKDIVNNIKAGMGKTENTNFGGGNTKWEEEKLGKYMYSETRLTEVLEGVCTADECYDMLEKYEDALEDWWFNIHGKGENINLYEWLCIEKMMICCFDGTYGPHCKPCLGGGRERPCYGNGKCNGDGTRSGTGICKCDTGYDGYECSQCAPLNYTSHHNDTHIECKGCHKACLTSCFDEGAQGCEDCAKGWIFETEKGCVDVNECESNPCDDDEYCQNEDGAYSCEECDEVCSESCIGPGPGNCNSCRDLFYKDDKGVCKACHDACVRSCTDGTARTCDSCKPGWSEDEEMGCLDIDECGNELVKCGKDEYCVNTHGSHKCLKCHESCRECSGAGNNKCVGYCADGWWRGPDRDYDRCVDVDECAESAKIGRALCPEDGSGKVCVNTKPGYKCVCPEGERENKKTGKCVLKIDYRRRHRDEL